MYIFTHAYAYGLCLIAQFLLDIIIIFFFSVVVD